MTIIPTSDALNQTTVMRQVRKLAECINSRDGGLIENIELTEDNQVYTMTITYANGQTQELEWDSVSVGISDITIGYNDGIYTFTFLLTDGTTKTFTIPIGDVVTEEELSTALSTKADTSTVNTLDAQNVKKTGTSVVTGDIQVPITPTNPTSVVNSVYVNDATNGVNNIVHKSGDEAIAGIKDFYYYQKGVMRETINIAPPSDVSLTPCVKILKINTTGYFKIKLDALAILGGFIARWAYNVSSGVGGMIKSWGGYRLYFVIDNDDNRYFIIQFPSGFGRNQVTMDYVIDGQSAVNTTRSWITPITDATPEAIPTVGDTYTTVIEVTGIA